MADNKTIGKIRFHYNEITFRLSHASERKSVLTHLLRSEGIDFNIIDYIFCDDSFLIKLNKKYLNHDTYTDILTFHLSEEGDPLSAEIYISTERVKENAFKSGIPFRDEVDRVMAHGLLHLCGYNDHTPDEIKVMRSKEDFYLQYFRKAY